METPRPESEEMDASEILNNIVLVPLLHSNLNKNHTFIKQNLNVKL